MNYTIFNYKGDVLNESISHEELDSLIKSEEFNCFQWGEDIYTDFLKHDHDDAATAFHNFRVYKLIVE
jgi:hypothetical protein